MAKAGDVLGRWKLLRRIGGGGQGDVFEASTGEGAGLVAIKVIRTVHPKQVERFRVEMAIHRRLTDRRAPNVMPLLDANIVDEGDGAVGGYLVMPLAHSKLSDHLALLSGRVDLCLEVLRGVAVGIGEAHKENVVHRDVKPGNILFLDESLKTPLVSDFGICLLRDTPDEERITEVGETVGARFFMAPEQDHGGKVDVTPTADIYALAKLLHYMLTGRFLTRERIAEAFLPAEVDRDARLATIKARILEAAVVEDPVARIKDIPTLVKIIDELRNGAPPHEDVPPPVPPAGPQGDEPNQPKHSVTTPEGGNQPPVVTSYTAELRRVASNNPTNFSLGFDAERLAFTDLWSSIYQRVQGHPRQSGEAVIQLIDAATDVTGRTLALARTDSGHLFLPWKRFLEFVLRSSEGRSGYAAVFTVPHVLAGFQYMAASVAALQFESWSVFTRLLNDKFEWYYQSGRPLYSYGFSLSYFFHPEALNRDAAKVHDLFREVLCRPEFLRILTISKEDLLDRYVQVQLAQSLRGAQAEEAGEDGGLWPDFGRFYAHRAIPLLDRINSDPDYSSGFLGAFHEDKREFFQRINLRLHWAQQRFANSQYMWESIATWEPKH